MRASTSAPRAGDPDPANPGLWFTGFVPGFTGYFDAVATVAERIAAGVVEAGALSRPIRTPEPRIEALSAW